MRSYPEASKGVRPGFVQQPSLCSNIACEDIAQERKVHRKMSRGLQGPKKYRVREARLQLGTVLRIQTVAVYRALK